MKYVSAAELHAMIRDDDELALLDVREEAVFGDGHLLFAVPVSLNRLELRLPVLVPRHTVRMVLCDGGEGLAARAAVRIEAFGYNDVAVLDGGIDAWRAAGYELFSGINVPSKAFGEFIEAEYHTPSISAQELKQSLDAGDDTVVLDSRPMDEYHAMNIPGGVCCPGGELVYRFLELAPSPQTRVVVNCAGRTRSIIGAQSLINAAIPNPVVALRNGTMGWHLAGFELERASERHAPAVSIDNAARARSYAAQVADRYAVRHIDHATLGRWQSEAQQRSLYLLDVRSPEEYAAGHIPGSFSAPGGQLVQATDRFVATLRARLVLIDDDGVRAAMAASWLEQMGSYEVAVLEGGLAGAQLERGKHQCDIPGLQDAAVEFVSAETLQDSLTEGTSRVIDLSDSRNYRRGHIPGAWYALRSDLAGVIADLTSKEATSIDVVLTSEDGVLAALAAADLSDVSGTIKVLDGGNDKWRAASYPFGADDPHLASEPEDAWLRPYDRGHGVEDAMQNYLSWEVDLVHQIERDATVRFRPA